jgi:uncharacterized protein YozE (UPF0346 family)
MTFDFSSISLDRLRREAKKLSREQSISHSEALDRIAEKYGFKNWSLLAKRSASQSASHSSIRPSTPAKPIRYYLHGDVVEQGPPAQYYCARCDIFCDLDHFQQTTWHHNLNHGDKFLSGFAAWKKVSHSLNDQSYRPADAPNIFQADAEAARAAREASRAPFHRWLESQRGRRDPVGDLARDVLGDKDFPTHATTRREVEDYLSSYGDHVIRAVRQAWKDFQQPRKKTFAQALAEELGITELEAEQLVDVEPQELTGNRGEMVYAILLDFTDIASPELAAKLMKQRNSLQLEVGPWFFNAIDRYTDL